MCDGADAGIASIHHLFARGELVQYRLIYLTRADRSRRALKNLWARDEFVHTLAVTRSEPERLLLQAGLASVSPPAPGQLGAQNADSQPKVILQDTPRQKLQCEHDDGGNDDMMTSSLDVDPDDVVPCVPWARAGRHATT